MVDLDEVFFAAVAQHGRISALFHHSRFLSKGDELARSALHRFIVGAACRKEVGCPGDHFLNVQVLVVPKFDKEREFIVTAQTSPNSVKEPKRDAHSFCARGDEKGPQMRTIGKGALALTLVGGLALFSAPSWAVEPDVDSSAGPELPAPRTSDPDFQQDNQPGALIDPEVEGANPTRPRVVEPEPVAPDTVIVPE
jgi:hypothetical protein